MDKYNKNELDVAISKAIEKGIIDEGTYTCLIFTLENHQNEDGYVNAKRFGYNSNIDTLDYLECTDIMPFDISYNKYTMDFIPGGVQLFRKDKQPFKVSSLCYCNTIIEE